MVEPTFPKIIPVICSVLLLTLIVKCTSFRLPNNIEPILYNLDLDPHIDSEKFTFDGNSSTLFKVLHPTNTVTIHVSKTIHIQQNFTKIKYSNDTFGRPISQIWNSRLEHFEVKFDYTLPIGEYIIIFKWNGDLGTKKFSTGFIRQKVEVNGTFRNLLSTVFEPQGARHVFPCWDEPGFKSQILLSVKHSTQYRVISNMPVQKTLSVDNETIWTIFERSPPMCTYHLNIIVGVYEGISNQYNQYNMTFWTQPDKLDYIKFTSKWTPLIVAVLENYTGITYSLPKLDSVHVPNYPSEANEHWGAITYSKEYQREPGKRHTNNDFHIAMSIAHEVSHQWFGNLVTHKWWNDLWLTESFSTYFSYKMLNDASSKWLAKDRFAVEVVNVYSFIVEQLNTYKHPIRFIPDKPSGPEEKFENIVYEKGAGVVQMLEHILSENVFRNGLRKYLNKHKFGSVTTEDLFVSLQVACNETQQTSHLDIKEIMDSWLNQKGHPLLNVTRNYETGVVTVTQTDAIYPNSNSRWKIPITFATTSEPKFEDTQIIYWMDRTTDSFEIHGIDKNDWIILNKQSKDLYEVIYDPENLKRITAYLNSENYYKIHLLNRAKFLYDGIEQSRSNTWSLERMIDTITYLSREIHPLPWKLSINYFSSVLVCRKNCPAYNSYRKFASYIFNNIIDHIGFNNSEDDDDLILSTRFQLINLACKFGHRKCREMAFAKLVEVLKMEIKLTDHDERYWVYCSGLSLANETIWDLLLDDFPDITFEFLGCTKNQTLINKYLMYALHNSSFWTLQTAVLSILNGPEDNYDYALDFFINHFDKINKHRSAADRIPNLLDVFIDKAATLEHQDKLTKFLNEKDTGIENIGEHIKDLASNVEYEAKFCKRLYDIVNRNQYIREFLEQGNDI